MLQPSRSRARAGTSQPGQSRNVVAGPEYQGVTLRRVGPRPCAILFCRSNYRSIGVWRSLVARVVRDDEAAGSNPVTPTL